MLFVNGKKVEMGHKSMTGVMFAAQQISEGAEVVILNAEVDYAKVENRLYALIASGKMNP